MTRRRQVRLRGVRVHNLKGVDLDLPLGKLVAFTGVSGSGKSSLAFDTLYAEGQRRYIETFSAYTRQFLEALDKPDADLIEGIPPAVAVAQRVSKRSGRSTVGTVTETQDALGLLFAKLGRVICRVCGDEVHPANPATVERAIDGLAEGTRYLITYPLEVRPESDRAALADALREDGFTRVRVGGEVVALEEGPIPEPGEGGIVDVVVDRLVRGSDATSRRLDSIETAFSKGFGRCRIVAGDEVLTFYDGWRCSRCGADYLAPEPRLFRFNSPLGACPTCEGFGRVVDLDLERVVPDPTRSLRDGAIVPWTTPAYQSWNDDLVQAAGRMAVPLDVPFRDLTPEQVGRVVNGDKAAGFPGLRGFFARLDKKVYKMHVRIFLARWRGYKPCPDCQGARLRPEALAVRVGGRNLAEVDSLTIAGALAFLDEVAAAEAENPVARGILAQARNRLDYLERIGLGYLTLDRLARTLSAGEARRVALTSALGSGLVNTLYVLDEPSIGLHPTDVGRLIAALVGLRDSGNSVVVVEHDMDIVRASDHVVEVGPGAGDAGGRILFTGTPEGLAQLEGSATGDVLSGRGASLAVPKTRRKPSGHLKLTGARGHNLKGIDVDIPLGVLCVVTGVSGSGKSTLVEDTLFPALARRLKNEPLPAAPFDELTGTEALGDVALVDQSPIGRTPRSNPVTYLKAFDEIRKTFAETHEAKLRNFSASRFSFNVEGGRCDACEGNGYQVVDMQFMPDVMLRCPVCRGRRYRSEVLEITYRGKSIAEVLDLTAREAFRFFANKPKVQSKLRPLIDVGLDYLRLGQPASTLSGGEAQRLKLANFLASTPAALTRAAGGAKTLFILDEPTTGLHPLDTLKLMDALTSLIDVGHSLVVVEHSPEFMAAADWIIDVGPGPGADGGTIVAQGTPEQVAKSKTPTGTVLAGRLGKKPR
ncbi:excinuclease ABC subunit UvrA [Isosphaeraceae bacterium EP7]